MSDKTEFTVKLEIPEGVSKVEMAYYIKYSVASMKGSLNPECNLFYLDGDSVEVSSNGENYDC